MCGASPQQKEAFANETKVSGILTNQLQQFAGQNQEILNSLTSALTPIEEAGPEQFGFAPAEAAAMRTDVAEQLNAGAAQTANAVRGALASRGGGTTYLPSGSEASILGTLAQDTAVKEAEAQAGITQKGYDIGRQNWQFATEGLMKAPGELEAPINQAGGAAVGAAEGAMSGANAITAANQAWMQPVGAIIGATVKGATGGGLPSLPGGGGAPPIYGAGDPNATGA